MTSAPLGAVKALRTVPARLRQAEIRSQPDPSRLIRSYLSEQCQGRIKNRPWRPLKLIMKTFKIFTHPERARQAVKVGFSWPAFFFGILWMFSKALWKIAGTWIAASLILIFVENAIRTMDHGPGAEAAINISLMIFYLFFFNLIPGIMGNSWREKKMLNMGYRLEGTVSAPSPAQALKTA